MNRDDSIALAELVLQTQQMQVATLKLVSARFDLMHELLKSYARLHQLGDTEQVRLLRSQIEQKVREFVPQQAVTLLSDEIARAESLHEHLEAFLAKLKTGSSDLL